MKKYPNNKQGICPWSTRADVASANIEPRDGVSARVPPRKSLARRSVAMRSKGSFRGTIINPINHRELHYESILERDAAYILMTDPRVAELQEQFGPVPFENAEGGVNHHFFDFRVRMRDGSTHLIAVKYQRDVDKSGICDVVSRIRTQRVRDPRHFVHLRTDRHFTRVKAENARLVFAANRDAARADIDKLIQAIQTFEGIMTAQALLAVVGLDTPEGFLALAHVFGLGLICCTDKGLLTHASRISAVRSEVNVGDAR